MALRIQAFSQLGLSATHASASARALPSLFSLSSAAQRLLLLSQGSETEGHAA
jgi:hypothetical protein